MATILFEGLEFDICPDMTAGLVLGAACMKYARMGDVFRFKLIDEDGRELEPREIVGWRRLTLCDVQKLHRGILMPERDDYRRDAAAK